MKGIFRTTGQGPDNTEVGLRVEQAIPFVPPLGAMVAPIPGGSFMEVEGVMWDAARPMEVELHVADPAGLELAESMRFLGWTVEVW